MKKQYLVLLSVLCSCALTAQSISFENQEILFIHPDANPFNNQEFDSPYFPCDYNNDGYVDFVGKGGFTELFILKGTAADTFQQIDVLASLPPGAPFTRTPFDVMDFDQDGDEDIITENYILLNEGEDVFSLIDLPLETGSGIQEFVIGIADFNDDDHLDLLVLKDVFFEDAVVSILTNDGDNSFSKCVIYDQGDDLGDTEIGDIDLDGDLDIIISSGNSNGEILIFKQEGDCQFALSTLIYENFTPFSERSIAVQDMNGDDQLDIAVIAFSSIFIFENTDGFVTEPPFVNLSTGQNTFFNLADFNNDNQADIAVVTKVSGSFRLEVFENLGDFNFSSSQQVGGFSLVPAHGLPDYNYLEQNMRIYDYDNSGTLDIIYTNGFSPSSNNNISWIPNNTVIVGVEKVLSEAIDLPVFPNPTTTEINFPLREINDREATFFQLINGTGQIVKSGYLTSAKMDTSDLADGQYFLLLYTGNKVYRSPFIKL